MSINPTKGATFRAFPQPGNQDALQVIFGPNGQPVSWIDAQGFAQGNLAAINGKDGAPGSPGAQGPVGSISAAPGPNPWFDVQAHGAKPRSSTPPSTTATTNGTTAVTLANAEDFVDGDGLVIFTAGAATLQSTPNAPTVSMPSVTGAATYNYKCVGVDSMGGLTAASAAGQTTTGPAVFGNNPVTISSISQAANVVTVNFSSPINAVVGMQIAIKGFTSGSAIFNGFWSVATAPTTSQITFALTGNFGSGTVSGSTTGRLCNTYNITAASRSGTTLSFTTDTNHNFQVGAIVIIDGVPSPSGLIQGQYIISTASGTGFTCAGLAYSGTETGTIQSNSTATVYEYADVKCPAVSGTTVQYYIYGDYGTGTYSLIGKTLPKQRTFRDWGLWIGSGFVAPSYVPSTPPASAQNQMYAGIISSGAGTTSLVMHTAVPSSVSGAKALHDEGVLILAVFAAAASTGGGIVFISPASTGTDNFYYINSPIDLAPYGEIGLHLGCSLQLNETLSSNSTIVTRNVGPQTPALPQFAFFPNSRVEGLASPLVVTNNATSIDGILFAPNGNNQCGLFIDGDQNTVTDCSFVVGTQGSASVPLIINGGSVETHLTNLSFLVGFQNISDQNGVAGTLAYGPQIPAFLIRADEPSGEAANIVLLDGQNNFSGRGIMIDFSFVNNGFVGRWDISAGEVQGPTTPFLMLKSVNGSYLTVRNANCDSATMAAVANFGSTISGVDFHGISTSVGPVLTGSVLTGVRFINPVEGTPTGQNYSCQTSTHGFTSISSGNAQQRGQQQFAEPVILDSAETDPICIAQAPPVLVSVTVTGVGTLDATFAVNVTAVGWNGRETAFSNTITVSPINQQLVIDWDAVSNIQGYNVYLNGFLQNSSPITALTITLSSKGNRGTGPALASTGMPLMDANQVATPLIRMPNGFFKIDVAAGTLSASHNLTLLDSDGSVPVLVSAPAHDNSTGVTGQIAYDGTYFYICSATNTWQRVAVGGSW